MASTGEAGRRGPDIRSDCWVRVTLESEGTLKINMTSMVESMYGDSIRALTSEVLTTLGITHATVEIEDNGALPFVLAARIECAARRAGPVRGTYAPPMIDAAQYGTQKDRMRRSRLYLPGDSPKFFINAGLHGADALILDLEDSVSPSEKDSAQILVRNTLCAVDFKGAERMVRINQLPAGFNDLEWIIPCNVHVVLLPKCESALQVREVDECIQRILKRNRSDRDVYLMPIMESAMGAIRAYEIASACPRVVALAVGLEDYTADIGTNRTLEGKESFWARSMVVNAARAARIQPIDTVFSDVGDMEGLKASVLEAKGLGFEGKGCIHPRQISVIHEAFAPTEAEIEKALCIVKAFEKAEAEGLGVVSLGSKMIDPPVVKRALRTVKLAQMSGLLEETPHGSDA
ncbi:MAG: aldolase/citrate lyase family protein [Planctomycetota bacterium]